MTLRIAAEGKTVSKQGKFVSNHDVKSGGGPRGSELNVTMTLINFSSDSLDVPPKYNSDKLWQVT